MLPRSSKKRCGCWTSVSIPQIETNLGITLGLLNTKHILIQAERGSLPLGAPACTYP